MRRFQLSSPNIDGYVLLTYKQDGMLGAIDFANANINRAITKSVKQFIPDHVSDMSTAFNGTTATIIETDFEVSFEDFWREYPYKRNKHLAEAYWPKMPKGDQVAAWQAATAYRKYADRNEKWYNPKIADMWLKKKEFLNDWKKL